MDQNPNDGPTFNTRDVRRRADDAAASFDSADFVHTVTRDGLLERMRPLVIEPARILDLGAATGSAAAGLRKRFGSAHLVSLDLSLNMLRQAKRKRPWLSRARSSFVQADAARLPIEDGSIDLVFSNLLLPFAGHPQPVFEQVARVLRKDGVFAFATLGPDSLLELRRAWGHVDEQAHVSQFPDMHDVGDGLVAAGLRDPVLDVDRLTLEYDDVTRLFSDLRDVGARNTLQQRRRSLLGRGSFAKMQSALAGASEDGRIRLELELVYGHCWGGGPRMDPTNYMIDASRIPRRRG
ncbi:MAG: methyltransferase domain-containing protein [Woeseiaceae bacterium]